MTPQEAHEEALRRIAQAKREHAEILDLGDLPLEELPEELGELSELAVLALGQSKPYVLEGKVHWEFKAERSRRKGHGIQNLQPLARLTKLRWLDLDHCRCLTDLQQLAGLTKLRQLVLRWCERLTDIQPLAGLRNLQLLGLDGCINLTDVQPLSGLALLRELRLSGCLSLTDVKVLAGLRNLQRLDLDGCINLTDVQPLAGLTSLRQLGLCQCNLTDLHLLAELVNVRRLDLGSCENLTDVRSLSELRNLEDLCLSGCKHLTDLRPLAELANLQELDLRACEHLTDVQPLSRLTNLRTLFLDLCRHLSDVHPLTELPSLTSLSLSQCARIDHFAPLRPLLPRLEILRLFGCQFADLPDELCGRLGENVLDKVRAHYADLEAGPTDDAEVKVFILGNGGVGKTQLCRKLQGLAFDPAVPTTHGVQLGHSERGIPGRAEAVRLNLWDFGGQDIYHGAHTLFVQGQAVFLLLWTPELESGAYEEAGVTLRRRPLAYWLDYVRGLAGTECPVLVIQSQCDDAGKKKKLSAPQPDDFRFVKDLQYSSLTEWGKLSLDAGLAEAVQDLLSRRPPQAIGVGRVEVRNRLRGMLEEDQKLPPAERRHRTLSVREFRDLCTATGKVSDPAALLDFLHHPGVVFHRPGLFQDWIILDQSWALEAIYSLFHRLQELQAVLRDGRGRFTRQLLAHLVWHAHSEAEQQTFLSMMESCGICFRVRRLPDRSGHDDWEYIAPELLPERSGLQDQLLRRLRDDPPGAEAVATFEFLHEGILRTFLSKLGEWAGDDAIYWKFGCWFYEKTSDSEVLIDSEWGQGPGTIKFQAWGARPSGALAPLVQALLKIPLGRPPKITHTWGGFLAGYLQEKGYVGDLVGDLAYVALNEDGSPRLEQDKADAPHVVSLTTIQAAAPTQVDLCGKSVYVSYAWGDDRSDLGRQREQVVEGLCPCLERRGWLVLRDKKVSRLGDSIADFMKQLGRGQRVIVILSDKYLRSPYCMTELHYVYQHALGEKADFLQRIVPAVLEDANIGSVSYRIQAAKHWREKLQELEENLPDLGAHDYGLYQKMKLWQPAVGDMLSFIADMLCPQGFAEISRDDFAAVQELLERGITRA